MKLLVSVEAAAPESSASKAGRCAGNFAAHLAALRASVPLRSAPKAPREVDLKPVHEADPKAAHGVDLAVAREALPFVGVHAVPPLVGDGQPGHEVVAAALVQQRNPIQKPSRRIIYKVGLSSHTLFSSQAINASRSATTS